MRLLASLLVAAVLALLAVAALAWHRASADADAGLNAKARGMAGVLQGAALEAVGALEAAESHLTAQLAAVARRTGAALGDRGRPARELFDALALEERVGRLAWFDAQGRLLALGRHPAPLPQGSPEARALRERAEALERDELEAAAAAAAPGPGEIRPEGLRPNPFATRERFGLFFGLPDGGRLLVRADADALAALRRRFGLGPVLERVRALPDVAAARLVDASGEALPAGSGSAPGEAPAGPNPGADGGGLRVLSEPHGVRVLAPLGAADGPAGTGVALDLTLTRDATDEAVARSRRVLALGALLGAVGLAGAGLLLWQRERRRLRAQAQEAARLEDERRLAEMGALTALVTHELANPLNAVRLGLSLLGEEAPPDQRARVRATLEAEVTRMGRTLEAFLGRARTGPGALEAVPPALLEAVRARTATHAAARGVRVLAVVDREAPAARGDALLLEQALTNLVRNAVDASPRGGEVRLGWGGAPDGEVRLCVEDRGRGFPAEGREALLSVGAAGSPGGHGLGLPLALRCVRQMGGRLTLEDRDGGGARVVVRLPAEPR